MTCEAVREGGGQRDAEEIQIPRTKRACCLRLFCDFSSTISIYPVLSIFSRSRLGVVSSPLYSSPAEILHVGPGGRSNRTQRLCGSRIRVHYTLTSKRPNCCTAAAVVLVAMRLFFYVLYRTCSFPLLFPVPSAPSPPCSLQTCVTTRKTKEGVQYRQHLTGHIFTEATHPIAQHTQT